METCTAHEEPIKCQGICFRYEYKVMKRDLFANKPVPDPET
jgi:hypothetical protein